MSICASSLQGFAAEELWRAEPIPGRPAGNGRVAERGNCGRIGEPFRGVADASAPGACRAVSGPHWRRPALELLVVDTHYRKKRLKPQGPVFGIANPARCPKARRGPRRYHCSDPNATRKTIGGQLRSCVLDKSLPCESSLHLYAY